MKNLSDLSCNLDANTNSIISRDHMNQLKDNYNKAFSEFSELLNDCQLDITTEMNNITRISKDLYTDSCTVYESLLKSSQTGRFQVDLLVKNEIEKNILEMVENIKTVYPMINQSINQIPHPQTLNSFVPLLDPSVIENQDDSDENSSTGSNSNRNSFDTTSTSTTNRNSGISSSSSNLDSFISNTSSSSNSGGSSLDVSNKQQQQPPVVNNVEKPTSSWGCDLPQIIISLDEEEDEDTPVIWSLPISSVSNDPFNTVEKERSKSNSPRGNNNNSQQQTNNTSSNDKKKKWFRNPFKKDTSPTNTPVLNSPKVTNGNGTTTTSSNNTAANTSSTNLKKSTSTTGISPSLSSSTSTVSQPLSPRSLNTSTSSSPSGSSLSSSPSLSSSIGSSKKSLHDPSPLSPPTTSNSTTSTSAPNNHPISTSSSSSTISHSVSSPNPTIVVQQSVEHLELDDLIDYEDHSSEVPVGLRGNVQDVDVVQFEPQKEMIIEEIGVRSKRFTAHHLIGFDHNERHITHYQTFFHQQDHYNFYACISELGGNVIISIKKEAELGNNRRHRVLIQNKNGTEKILINSSSNKESDLLKGIINYLKPIVKLQSSSLKSLKLDIISQQLLEYEKLNVKRQYHFYLLFRGEGQTTESQMLNNEHVSKEFIEFYKFIGKPFLTKNWKKYSGGLDITSNLDGNMAIYSEIHDIEVVFHVSYMLTPEKRKEILSNNTVVIVYSEGNKPLSPSIFTSPKNQIFFDIRKVKVDDGSFVFYKFGTISNQLIPPFGPMISDPPYFRKEPIFKQYLLTKLINATNSSLSCPHLTQDLIQKREFELDRIISLEKKKR
eukprot:gene7751-9536_t